jgi:hypothetical protein
MPLHSNANATPSAIMVLIAIPETNN